MRLIVLQATSALLLLFVAGCGNDATTPTPPLPDPSLQDGLWTVSGSPSAILRLDPTQLSDTGQRDPATTLTTPSALLHTLAAGGGQGRGRIRSEEHTSELQSRPHLVCRLLLEKKIIRLDDRAA